jgi:transcriptional regulator with XRE-family HTH domain
MFSMAAGYSRAKNIVKPKVIREPFPAAGHNLPMRTPTTKGVQVGARIRKARDAQGLSQEQLAERLGVTKGLVSQYETGLTSVPSKRFSQLAEVLGVSSDWLLTGGEPDEQTKAQTKAELEGLMILRAMAPDEQRRALRLLAAFNRDITGSHEKK